MKVHTEAVQFKADAKLRRYVEYKLSKLEHFFGRIIDAQVILKLENNGQVKDKVAEIKLNIPGVSLFSCETKKTFEASVAAGVESIRRQLKRHKARQRRLRKGLRRAV